MEIERKEKIRLENANEFDMPRDFNKGRNLITNSSIENLRFKKRIFLKNENEKHSPLRKDFRDRIKTVYQNYENNESEINNEEYKENNLQEKVITENNRYIQNYQEENSKKEEMNVREIPIKKLYITKNEEKIQVRRASKVETESNKSEEGDSLKGMVYKKKKLSIKTDKINNDETNQISVSGENKYVDRFKDKMIKKHDINIDEEKEDEYSRYRDNNIVLNNKSTLLSNLSETFKLGGRPTKIKIYKCVIWKNLDPNDSEDIKNKMHRSSSQLYNNGGFIVKIPQSKTYKAKKNGFI
jgi:hypothetical protein